MEKRYYIPKEEEFHPGFEFEMNVGTGYSKQIFPLPWWKDGAMGGFNTLTNALKGSIRVKSLDNDDAVSLGWTQKKGSQMISNTQRAYWFIINENDKNLCWNLRLIDDGVWITQGIINHTRFIGFLKNVSELKKIMQQLGIQWKQ